MSRVSRRLQIKTALGSVFEFSLIATIPSELMPLCANAAGRPVWEFHVYVSAIAVMICLLMVVLVMARFEANKLVAKSLATLHSNTTLLNGSHINGELFDLRKITAPSQTPTVSNNPCQPRQENGSTNVQCSRTEVTTHTSMYSQTSRRNSSDSYERFVSNNNSISPKTSEDEHNRGKGKSSEGFIKDSSKKQKRGNSGSRTPKRRDSGSEASKPVPLCNSAVALEAIADEVFQSHLPNNGGTSPTFSRGSSSSETNSVCSDVPTIATKKEKPKGRKKTAKVFPVVIPVDEKKSKAGDKEKVKSAEKAKENEKSKEKEKEKEKERNNTSEKRKDKRNKHDVEIKEHSKESRKHEGQFKTPKFENDKVSRRVSLPVELEHTNSKPKEDKPKSHQSLVTSTAGKNQGNSSRSVTSGSSKKAKAVHSNSLPTVTRARKQTSEPREFSNEVLAPHTITEAINSALERTLKHSPTSDTGNQKSSPHNLSRCSSLSPSPSPSDLSPNLSQSSRSSSYSSVVGSEESGSGSSEHSGKRKKARKPSPLTIQKKTGTSSKDSLCMIIHFFKLVSCYRFSSALNLGCRVNNCLTYELTSSGGYFFNPFKMKGNVIKK